MNPSSNIQADVVVTGRVQGVGFRDFAERTGLRMGLRGTVRNRPDGTVHVVVEGPEDTVNEFLAAIRRGPSASRVEDLAVVRGPASGRYSTFTTEYGA